MIRLGFFLKSFSVFFLFCVFVFLLFFIYYAKDLPRPEVFTEKDFVLPTKIYDREGKTLLYQIYDEEKRTVISLDQVSNNLKWAIIATEDSNFYHHFGLDLKGVARSIINNLTSGKWLATGGSTISQQLIRSTFLTLDKTVRRKAKEIILTLELERRYSKDQILEFYLNQIPLGSNAYGVEAASQVFFNKSASELSLAQAAAVASLIQAPSRLSPYGSRFDCQKKLRFKSHGARRIYFPRRSRAGQKRNPGFCQSRPIYQGASFCPLCQKVPGRELFRLFPKRKGLKSLHNA